MSHAKAIAHLRAVDPRLAAVIEEVGKCGFQARAEGTHFGAVARSIVYQQLSGKAASTIHGRFTALFDQNLPAPTRLLELSDEELRSAGLSRQKSSYLRHLATLAHSGELAVDSLHDLGDDEIVTQLTAVKGVGRWTAQMFLMFRLGRLDILPDLDLGIQKGLQRAYRMRKLPKPKQVAELGAKWAPYRSIASWYLWRFADAAPETRQGASPAKKGAKQPVGQPVKKSAPKRKLAKKPRKVPAKKAVGRKTVRRTLPRS